VTVNQSTFSGNSATNGIGGGLSASSSYINFVYFNLCTVSGNVASAGGGIGLNANGWFFIFNSIVSDNAALNLGGDIYNVETLTYGGVNIVHSEHDIYPFNGPVPLRLAPKLAPLGNYGGPTLTMLPLPGSPALDAGSDAVTNTTDQRGWTRLAGLHVDIGAVEVQSGPATTLAATNVTTTTATGNGVITAGDLTNTWYFAYGPTTNYGTFSQTNILNPSYTPTNVNVALANLLPATTYHFQILVNDGFSVKSGGDMTFTTPASAPITATLPATDVYATTATLNATINPGGLATQYYFRYMAVGGSILYIATNTLPAGNTNASLSANLTGLVPGTTFSYQIVAGNSLGTNFGSWLNFTCGHIRVVTDAGDATNSTGSLRSIVNSASSGDTITFTNTLSGATILLGQGAITLSKNLTIDGTTLPGGIAIDGNHNGSVISVAGSSICMLNALTITNGSSPFLCGGGVLNFGTLTLNGCTVAGSTAYAGGGVFNWGSTLTLNQCTLAGNSASTSGGGIFNYLEGGWVHVNQCTVTANSAAGSDIISDGGGGIINYGGTMTLSSTIVAGNAVAGNAPSSTANLAGSFTGGGNLIDGTPQLAPLGNYGGPTQTMPPLPGSPAIDACTNGIDPGLITDQRGFPRVLGAYADIGAVEGVYNPAGPGILTGMNRSSNGAAGFTFTNSTDMSFTVLASTNITWPLNLWSNLGPVVEAPGGSGHYQFTDPSATNSPQRFYRVRSP
jgi:hypothetical protein